MMQVWSTSLSISATICCSIINISLKSQLCIYSFSVCAELQSTAETQPPKQEETLVSYGFSIQLFTLFSTNLLAPLSNPLTLLFSPSSFSPLFPLSMAVCFCLVYVCGWLCVFVMWCVMMMFAVSVCRTPVSMWSVSWRRWRWSRSTSTAEPQWWRNDCEASWKQVKHTQTQKYVYHKPVISRE